MALYLGDKLISSNLAGGDTNPIGSVIAFAGSNAPIGYLMCDGSAVSRETYADLFAVIGTTYGSGDGSTTFNLPDFKEEYKKLLWENPNPTSDYSNRFVALDLNNFDAVDIVSKYRVAEAVNRIDSINRIYKGSKGAAFNSHGSFPQFATREAVVSNNGVQFGYAGLADGSSKQEGLSSYAIPIKIYGIKETTPIIKATHNVTIQGIGTIGEDEIVEKKTLLWTNPNPSASFEARTIGLDLSGYEGVEIFYRNATGTDDAGRSIKSEKCTVGDVIGLSGLGSTESQRLATVTIGGVSFGNGTYANAYGGTQISADSVIIPQKIYGIKHI